MGTIKHTPLYAQVKHDILDRILSHEWAPNTFLPNETALTEQYGVSIGTLRKALEELTHENFLVRQQGKGTSVAEMDESCSVYPFRTFFSREGILVYTQPYTLRYKLTNDLPEIATKLELDEDAEIVSLERVLYRKNFEEEFVLHDWVYIPREIFPSNFTFKKSSIPKNLYVFYMQQKMRIVKAEEGFSASMPDKEDVKYLGVSKKTPLCEVYRLSYNMDDIPVEYRISRYDPLQYTYKIQII